MKHTQLWMTIGALLIAYSLGGCVNNNTVKSDNSSASATQVSSEASTQSTETDVASAAPASVKALSINSVIPVAEKKGMIDPKALNECQLQSKFPLILKDVAEDENIQVNVTPDPKATGQQYRLQAEYTQIFNRGNAFLGHSKYTELHITLYDHDKKVAAADFGRLSRGGMFASFKGSCSVLGRTLKANAEDVVEWLNSPVDGARYGDR